MQHSEQRNPYLQEVRVELSQTTHGGRKRPDYTFYVSPEFREPRLFVEAKKPSTSVHDADNLLQAALYGWNAGLPIVVLHNVAELLVIDTRYRPDLASITQRVVMQFNARSLREPSTFDKAYYLLSREAVASGSVNAVADALPSARQRPSQHGLFQGGYRPIDLDFLQSLEGWRDELARALKNRNPWMDGPALTETTQRILDRLVLLRFLGDKGIETRITIASIAHKGECWANFQRASRQLDAIYNGIVYKTHALVDGTRMQVDDAAFLSICEALDPRDSQYDFVQIPIQILGSIYERFLGKVIVATERRARIEDRPQARKAGGVYYTPTHIVHALVDATLNPLVKGKSFTDLNNLRIVDPACGSGSFLIAAFDKLVTAAAEWFNANPAKAEAAGCHPVSGGGWRLSLALKRELLVNCIFGIDLDHQAVEVAQLSLSLKLLEDETASSAYKGQQEFAQALLPSLAYNVVGGNALIDVDFYGSELFPYSDLALRPTNLKLTFAKVFRQGGFDAVLGNPPYLFITELSDEEKSYFQRRYETTEYRFDVYGLFIERAATELLREGGRLGYIIPHTLLANDSFEKLRRLLLEKGWIDQIVDIGPGVFQGARNETMLLVYQSTPAGKRTTAVSVTTAKEFPVPRSSFRVRQSVWAKNPKATWLVHVDPAAALLLERMDSAPLRLCQLCTVNQGLRTGNNEKYLTRTQPSGANWERAAGGAEVQRYLPISQGMWVLYDPSILDAPRKRELFDRPEKIVVQEIRNISLPQRIVATLDRDRTFCLQSTNVIGPLSNIEVDLPYLLGVLNSSIINHYFRLRFPANNHIASNQLAALPIPMASEAERMRISQLVESVIAARVAQSTATAEHQRDTLQVRISALEAQIDRMVAGLFGVDLDLVIGLRQ